MEDRTYAIIQTLHFEGRGEWLETEIVFQGDYAECKEQITKFTQDFEEMYESMYEENVVVTPIEKYNEGTAYRVSCPHRPPLWAEFVIAVISL